MTKVLRLALTAGALLCYTSCGETSQNANQSQGLNQNQNLNRSQSNVAPGADAKIASPSPTAETASMTATVKNVNFSWKDDASGTPVTTIKVGGTVTWTMTSGTHSIGRVAPNPTNGCDELDVSFDSGPLTTGKSVTRTFDKPGTFGYHCGIHLGDPDCKTPPGTGRMPGVIKVVP